MINNEKLAKQAVKEILLKQTPKNDRLKWDKKRPLKKELETEYMLVKR